MLERFSCFNQAMSIYLRKYLWNVNSFVGHVTFSEAMFLSKNNIYNNLLYKWLASKTGKTFKDLPLC